VNQHHLEKLAARLRAPIPAPRPPKARPRKTWKRLKVGDMLVDKDAGSAWFVKALDSTGATLEGLADHPSLRSLGDATPWEERYIKMKTPRKRKET